jgi:hypothetical protein
MTSTLQYKATTYSPPAAIKAVAMRRRVGLTEKDANLCFYKFADTTPLAACAAREINSS